MPCGHGMDDGAIATPYGGKCLVLHLGSPAIRRRQCYMKHGIYMCICIYMYVYMYVYRYIYI